MDYGKLKFIATVFNESPKKADAIVCLEGDNYLRTDKSLELFEKGLSPLVLVSGGKNDGPGNYNASKMRDYLIEKGVEKKHILIEENSKNTREQAIEVMKIVKKRGWKSIILVASVFHQPRAFLTFLKAMNDFRLKIKIFNAPAIHTWFDKIEGTEAIRWDLLSEEFEKIKEYLKKRHLVSIKKGIEYQKWKEKQVP